MVAKKINKCQVFFLKCGKKLACGKKYTMFADLTIEKPRVTGPNS